VLIVDDHAGFRARARRMLEAEGWDIAGEAADGASAVRAASELKARRRPARRPPPGPQRSDRGAPARRR